MASKMVKITTISDVKDLINYTNSSFSIFPGLFLGLILSGIGI